MAVELNICIRYIRAYIRTYIRTADWHPGRQVCRRADPCGQLLQRLEMVIRENTGSVGKNFQNSTDVITIIAIAIDRNDCQRADSDCLRNLRVNTAIGCDVITAQ
jgi:hypothetical protein